MPSAFERQYARWQRRVQTLAPPLRKAYLDGFTRLRTLLDEDLLAKLISTGGIDRLLADAATPELVGRAFAKFEQQLGESIAKAGQYFMKDVPRMAPATVAGGLKAGEIAVEFNRLAEPVLQAVRQMQTRVMTTQVLQPVTQTIRDAAELGLQRGLGPRATARLIANSMPLAPNQLNAITNFERMLTHHRIWDYVPEVNDEGKKVWRRVLKEWRRGHPDPELLTRQLRDKRFDRTIRKMIANNSSLSSTQVERALKIYRKHMIAFNAETISRTSALNAAKQGQRLAWETAISERGVDPNTVWKRWQTVGDDRVREEHNAMSGETVLFSEPYSNGEMTPGESTFNCRCRSDVFMSTQDRRRQ